MVTEMIELQPSDRCWSQVDGEWHEDVTLRPTLEDGFPRLLRLCDFAWEPHHKWFRPWGSKQNWSIQTWRMWEAGGGWYGKNNLTRWTRKWRHSALCRWEEISRWTLQPRPSTDVETTKLNKLRSQTLSVNFTQEDQQYQHEGECNNFSKEVLLDDLCVLLFWLPARQKWRVSKCYCQDGFLARNVQYW